MGARWGPFPSGPPPCAALWEECRDWFLPAARPALQSTPSSGRWRLPSGRCWSCRRPDPPSALHASVRLPVSSSAATVCLHFPIYLFTPPCSSNVSARVPPEASPPRAHCAPRAAVLTRVLLDGAAVVHAGAGASPMICTSIARSPQMLLAAGAGAWNALLVAIGFGHDEVVPHFRRPAQKSAGLVPTDTSCHSGWTLLRIAVESVKNGMVQVTFCSPLGLHML